MTTNKPEVFYANRLYMSAFMARHMRRIAERTEPVVRLSDYKRLQAECEKLRTCLAETAGVAVTMLYESHKADTIKEFTVEQLSQMVETTKHLADANIQVEKVYRKAWDMAHGCAGSYLEGAQP